MDFALAPEHAEFLERVKAFAQTEVAPVSAAIDAAAEFPRALLGGPVTGSSPAASVDGS